MFKQGLAIAGDYNDQKLANQVPYSRDPIPGDRVGFRNPDCLQAAWRSENAVYLGVLDEPPYDDGVPRYYAHPFGEKTAKEIMDLLDAKPKKEGGRAAWLDERVLYIQSDRLPELGFPMTK
jgi:hypothetical protein